MRFDKEPLEYTLDALKPRNGLDLILIPAVFIFAIVGLPFLILESIKFGEDE